MDLEHWLILGVPEFVLREQEQEQMMGPDFEEWSHAMTLVENYFVEFEFL